LGEKDEIFEKILLLLGQPKAAHEGKDALLREVPVPVHDELIEVGRSKTCGLGKRAERKTRMILLGVFIPILQISSVIQIPEDGDVGTPAAHELAMILGFVALVGCVLLRLPFGMMAVPRKGPFRVEGFLDFLVEDPVAFLGHADERVGLFAERAVDELHKASHAAHGNDGPGVEKNVLCPYDSDEHKSSIGLFS
jgi:hypothetical protein